jgi:hypothetical protein
MLPRLENSHSPRQSDVFRRRCAIPASPDLLVFNGVGQRLGNMVELKLVHDPERCRRQIARPAVRRN